MPAAIALRALAAGATAIGGADRCPELDRITILNVRSGRHQAVLFMDTFEKTGITLLKVTDAIESDAALIFRKHDTP